MTDFHPPYRVEVTDRAADLHDAHQKLGDGEGSGVTATVGGRVMLLRAMGRLTFATLRDSSGAVQLMATAKGTEAFDRFSHLAQHPFVCHSPNLLLEMIPLCNAEERWHLR